MATNTMLQPISTLPPRTRPPLARALDYGRCVLRRSVERLSAGPLADVLPLSPAPQLARAGLEVESVPRHSSPVRPTLVALPKPRTVLAIGAHPDDVEIGCGGTLSRHAAQGDQIIILTLTGGEAAGDANGRAAESRRAAGRLGATLVMAGLEDTRLTDGPETISHIEDLVRAFEPDVVYTHTDRDGHQDHRAVHRASLVASRRAPTVCCYQSPSTTQEFRPSRFVEVSDYLSEKLALLEEFDSQVRSKDYLAPDLIRSTARYWGRFAGCRLVEPFEVIRDRIED